MLIPPAAGAAFARTADLEPADGARWTSKAGAWLGIGTSPGALVLGAGLAARHGGAVPLVGVMLGAAFMAALLYAQGMLGLRRPLGDGATLSAASRSYLRARSHRAVNLLLAFAMIGWFGFNVGLGGAGLGALLNLPPPSGQLLLGAPIIALSFAGMRRWNVIAVLTTASALALVALVTARLAAPAPPVVSAVDGAGLVALDVGAFIGFVAVFAVRAPDFSAGLRARGDLAGCVGLLVASTVAVALAGVGLQLGTGQADLVGALAGPGGVPAANLLVAIAVVAASFTTTHSGSLALRAVAPLGPRAAVLAVAAPGLALAAVRFDRLLLPWLLVLAALLPPLIVPMALESARRRRGRAPRLVPLWTWLPGAAIAVALTAAGIGPAALAGIAAAAGLSAWWSLRTPAAAGQARPDDGAA